MTFDIERDDVTGHYWRGLKSFQLAFSYGEPLARRIGVGQKIADWLLERGLIEAVENPQYRNQTCYRLSEIGRKVLKRGPRAKPPRKRPKLTMLKPRIATLDTRTVKPFRGK